MFSFRKTAGTWLLGLSVLLVLAQACNGDDDAAGMGVTGPPLVPDPNAPIDWAARADSTRALANPDSLAFRVYVEDVRFGADEEAIGVDVDWRNDGPDVIAGDYELQLRLEGPVTRTILVNTGVFDPFDVGATQPASYLRRLPADVVSGTYEARLRVFDVVRGAPLDVAIAREFFDDEDFWAAGSVTIP